MKPRPYLLVALVAGCGGEPKVTNSQPPQVSPAAQAPRAPSAPADAPGVPLVRLESPAGPSPSVVVNNPGDVATRRVLAFTAPPRRTLQISYVIGKSFVDAYKTSRPRPTIIHGTLTLGDATADGLPYRFAASAIERGETDAAGDAPSELHNVINPPSALARHADLLAGFVIEGTIATNGAVASAGFRAPNAAPAAQAALQELAQSLPRPLPLPTTPVGNGATFTVTDAWKLHGIELSLTYNCGVLMATGHASAPMIECTGNISGDDQQLSEGRVTEKSGTLYFRAALDTLPFAWQSQRAPAFKLVVQDEPSRLTLSYDAKAIVKD